MFPRYFKDGDVSCVVDIYNYTVLYKFNPVAKVLKQTIMFSEAFVLEYQSSSLWSNI